MRRLGMECLFVVFSAFKRPALGLLREHRPKDDDVAGLGDPFDQRLLRIVPAPFFSPYKKAVRLWTQRSESPDDLFLIFHRKLRGVSNTKQARAAKKWNGLRRLQDI